MKINYKNLLLLLCGSATSAFSYSPEAETLSFTDIKQKFTPEYTIEGFSFMPGVAFIDYDNDSWVDIYLSNGSGFPNALYKNQGDGTFIDVAKSAGLADTGASTGIGIGDINNDGFDDIYVGNMATMGDGIESNDAPDRIYLNNKNGTFTDITDLSGINEPGFTTSVGFFDYDSDGFLDIIVGRMIDMDFFNPAANRTNPTTRSHIYHNNGDLTFTEVTEEIGLADDYSTWAVVTFDYDNDNDMDVFYGHEQGPISVFRNDGGTFTNVTEVSGDVKEYGAWMGMAVGDYNNDGFQDIYASNISDLEITRSPDAPSIVVPPRVTWDIPWPTLFRNNGDGTFTDVGDSADVKFPQEFSWGTMFADFNNDTLQDIYLAQNFAPIDVIETSEKGAGPGRLFMNNGDETFFDATAIAGAENVDSQGFYLDARGAATADWDKDGNMDFYVVNVPYGGRPETGKPSVFENHSKTRNHWSQVRLIGSAITGARGSNSNAVGARVEISHYGPAEPATQYRSINGGGSAYSQSERILHFGLGDTRKRSYIHVEWPDGEQQTFHNIKADRRVTLVQGCSKPMAEQAYRYALEKPPHDITLACHRLRKR